MQHNYVINSVLLTINIKISNYSHGWQSAYHLITVITFVLTICHSLDLSLLLISVTNPFLHSAPYWTQTPKWLIFRYI